jgi:hypothetical protein
MPAMLDSAQSLPQDPVELHRIIAQLHAQLAEAERERAAQTTRIEQLLEAIELLRRKRFGPSADRVPEHQLALFDEVELEALVGELQAPSETPARRRRAQPAPSRPSASRCVAPCRHTCRVWSASSICPRR